MSTGNNQQTIASQQNYVKVFVQRDYSEGIQSYLNDLKFALNNMWYRYFIHKRHVHCTLRIGAGRVAKYWQKLMVQNNLDIQSNFRKKYRTMKEEVGNGINMSSSDISQKLWFNLYHLILI